MGVDSEYVPEQSKNMTSKKEEEMLSPKEIAQAYVKENTVEIRTQELLPLRRRCVDGRHAPDQAKDSFALAGADLGIVMALMRAGGGRIDGVSAYKAVSRALKNLGTSFFYHTDEHALHDAEHKHNPNEVCFGCGHGKKASMADLASRYGIDPEQQKLVIKEIESGTLKEGMANLDKTVLEGDHNELGVIVVESENMTVLPMNLETKQQYFIYDAIHVKSFMKLVWDQMVKDGSVNAQEIKEEMFMDSEGLQRDVTVDLLATSQGKPTFVAKETEGKLIIEQ